MSDQKPLSYKDAGVDINAGNALIERIKGVAKRTRRPEVMTGLGGFKDTSNRYWFLALTAWAQNYD